MFYWFALALVALSASLALAATISAWHLRRATPRNISLALSVAACVAVLVAAADFPLPLSAFLCTVQVQPGEPFTDRLRSALDDWLWPVWPCGRLDVVVEPRDLETPIAFGELVEMASSARVAIDIRRPAGIPSPEQEFLLTVGRRGADPVYLPIGTPIPASFTDTVSPRFADNSAAPLECQIDGSTAYEASGASLAELLDSSQSKRSGGPAGRHQSEFQGFHRLKCRRSADEQPSIAYVNVTSAGVIVASSDQSFVSRYQETCQGSGEECLEFSPDRKRAFGLELLSAVSETEAPPTASTLILDRPQQAASCARAHDLLKRGATVVVAFPGQGFLDDACKAWFPVKAKPNAEGLVFDRTSRLTFVFDDEFETGLDQRPSFGIYPNSACMGSVPVKAWEASSSEMQREAAKNLCQRIAQFAKSGECDRLPYGERFDTPSATLVRQFSRSPTTATACRHEPAHACITPGVCDCERLERSSPRGVVAELGEAFAAQNTAWEEELVVVFTHDQRPDSVDGTALTNFASRVHVVRVEDPYGYSLSEIYESAAHAPLTITSLPPMVEDAQRRPFLPHQEEQVGDCLVREVSLGAAAGLPGSLDPEPQARAEFRPVQPSWSRFLPHNVEGTARSTAAPVRFGWWQGPREAERAQDRPGALELAATVGGGLVERPLAIGAMVERGHLLFLSHSPLETHGGEVLGGMKLIEDIYTATEDFIGAVHGEVLAVTQRADGALWITVTREVGPDIQTLKLERPTGPGGASIVASLTDFDYDRRIFVYAVPAVELERFGQCEPLLVPQLGSTVANPPVHACPPDETAIAGSRMEAFNILEQLAHYTGGRVLSIGESVQTDERHSRTLGLGMLALTFLLAWGRRAVRRLKSLSAARSLRGAVQLARRRYDPPEAVVAATGDWDGRASTLPRTGAFGGFRPLEPGDRASAVVLGDLMLRQLQGKQVLPRVALRIEEAAPSVLILVNLGASMRVPEGGESGKARFASRVGLHIAASAWRIGGEVTLHAAGIAGDTEILAPARLGPGRDELEHTLKARLRQRPAIDPIPWPRGDLECGAVVYVSDFQLEDERELQAWLADLEGAGVRVAGVMVYAPDEFTMIEGGRLAGSGVWADRADWDPDDVFAAFCRRRDQIDRIFDTATTGGLVVAATTFNQDDVELALAGGRLLQILR